MGRKAVYKPKNNIYKEIIKLTQSVLYTPEPEEWFLQSFPKTKSENIREALSYLCHIGFLCLTEENCYAVGYDHRLVFCGVYHSDGKNGHLHPDSLRKFPGTVFIPQKWSMGAQHRDRVEVALEGDLFDSAGVTNGIVHSIAEPSGDFFFGRLQKIDGRFVVFPDEKELGLYIPVSRGTEKMKSGAMVFARFDHTLNLRKREAEKADIRQKKKSIAWDEICGGDEREYLPEKVIESCTVISVIRNEKEKIFLRYGIDTVPDLYSERELLALADKKAGKPATRENLTDTPAMLLSEQCAINIFKKDKIFRVSVHVPDVADLFVPDSESEKLLLRKCCDSELFPHELKEKIRFSDGNVHNALTVSFSVDENGNVFNTDISRTKICTVNEKNPLYEALCNVLPEGGISEAPVISAANDAAAIWFDERDIPAPFTHIYFTQYSEEILGIAKKLGFCDNTEPSLANLHKILKRADEKKTKRSGINLINKAIGTLTEVTGRECMTVEFTSPLSNYLSVLAQYCFVRSRQMRTTEQKTNHLKFIFQRLAAYNWRIEQIKSCREALFNLKLKSSIDKDKKYIGFFVARTEKNKALFWVNGAFGVVNNCPDLKYGDVASLYFDDVSIDCLDLIYKFSE